MTSLLTKLNELTKSISEFLNAFEGVSTVLSVEIPALEQRIDNKDIKDALFKVITNLQYEDIIHQEIEHIYKNLHEYSNLIEEKGSDDKDLITVINFLLVVTEKQMIRIDNNINVMISDIEVELLKVSKLTTERDEFYIKDIFKFIDAITYFRNQHNELKDGITVLYEMNKISSVTIDLNSCCYKETMIQNIIDTLTVDDERKTILEEFPELDIETTIGNNITLF